MTTNKDYCLECPNLMASEWQGTPDDDIQLCHACYSNETLRKYNYDKV